MADSESTAAFAELKDEGKGGKQSTNGKAAVTIPINPVSSSKPLPTTVPKPTADSAATDGFASLFRPSTAQRFTAEWFVFYLQQRRVLILLLLALFLLILVIWIGALGKAPAFSTGSAGPCQLFAEIIGDVISVCPPAVATVFYPSIATVNLGYGTVSSEDTSQPPSGIFVPRAVQSGFYTAIFVDPDSPSAKTPDNRSYLRGIVTNLRLYTNVTLSTGEWLVAYEAPAPPLGTGSHRYVWLVYRHSSSVSGIAPPGRNKFDVEAWFRSTWTQQPQLVAANFFRSAS